MSGKKPKSLFDAVFDRMDELVEGGEDPCVAAVFTSEFFKTMFKDEVLLEVTPSECLLVWELRRGGGA